MANYCTNCGSKITSEQKYCAECGSPLSEQGNVESAVEQTTISLPTVVPDPADAQPSHPKDQSQPSATTVFFQLAAVFVVIATFFWLINKYSHTLDQKLSEPTSISTPATVDGSEDGRTLSDSSTPTSQIGVSPTGMFGVSIPDGSRLLERVAETPDTDGTEAYSVSLSRSQIHSYFHTNMRASGWTPYMADQPTMLSFKKDNRVLAVVINSGGNSFTLMGGRR